MKQSRRLPARTFMFTLYMDIVPIFTLAFVKGLNPYDGCVEFVRTPCNYIIVHSRFPQVSLGAIAIVVREHFECSIKLL